MEKDRVSINRTSFDDEQQELIPKEEKEEVKTKESIIWPIFRTVYACVSNAGMMLTLRVWGEVAPEYSWFLCESLAIGFIPVFFFALMFVRFAMKQESTKLDGWKPVLKQSAFISFLLAFNYFGVSTGNPHLSGPVQVILAQIPTAFSLIFSSLLLRRRYSVQCWLGALAVIIGTLLSTMGPYFTSSSSNSNAPIGWSLIYLFGMLPLGFLPVIYEAFHKTKGSDGKIITPEWRVLVTNALLIVWLLIFLPLFMALGQPGFLDFNSNMKGAFSCIFTGQGGGHCNIAGWSLLAITIAAAAQMHSQVLLSKGETGAFSVLVLTMSPFLADAVYPIRPIMGEFTEIPLWWDGVAAVVCLFGVCLFAWYDFRDQSKYEKVDKSPFVRFFLKE